MKILNSNREEYHSSSMVLATVNRLKKYIKVYILKKLEVYTMYINHNNIQLKIDNDESESIIKLSMNHEL